MNKLVNKYRKNTKGITLIALIVTIIIMLILAGVSIAGLTGENGLIAKTNMAKEEAKISELQEKLELKKIEYVAEKKETDIELNEYIDYINDKEVIDKSKDVTETGEVNSRYVTLENEYVFLVEKILETGEIKITYQGKVGKLKPIIVNIEVLSKNTNSIKVQVNTRLTKNETYTYYIAKENEEYQKKEKLESNIYEYTELEQGEKYKIKVEVEIKDGGKASSEIIVSLGSVEGLTESNTKFTYNPSDWTNGDVKVAIETTVTGYTLQYKTEKTGESGEVEEWTNYTGEIELTRNQAIYARAIDSAGQSTGYATGNVEKIDKLAPTIRTEVQYVSQTVNSATVKLKIIDTESGLSTIKWYYKTSSQSSYNEPQTDSYVEINGTNLGVKTEQEKSHVFSSLSCGTTYNIYAEIYDVAGNKTRTPATGSINVTINHVYGTKTTTSAYLLSNATCTEVAVYYYKCNGCSEKGTSTYTNGNVLGHNYTSSQNGTKKSDATCTEPATYYDKCTRCGSDATTYHNSGSALGHTGDEGGTVTQYTSCTADGWRWYRCTRCHQDYSGTYKYESAWGHSMGSYYCVSTDKYNHHRVCSRCSYEETAEHAFRFGFPNGRTSDGAYIYCACGNHSWGVSFNTTYPGNSEYWAEFNYDHQNESASPSRDFGNRGIEDWWY